MIVQSRRGILAGFAGTALLAACGRAATTNAAAAPSKAATQLAEALAKLEKSAGGKLGAAVLDTADGRLAGHRINERFTMCSTFKLSLAAAILQQIDAGKLTPPAMMAISESDIVGHSPVVKDALAGKLEELDVITLVRAAQTQSDNAASNILLRKIGGPVALTAFWRSLGDTVTRLDRYEPELNTSHDGDPRDTTTPAAMAGSLKAMLTGNALTAQSRRMLIGWMEETQTGLKRLRAGFPRGWRAGDKTGTMNGAPYADKVNDIGIAWVPGREPPFMLAAFYESAAKNSQGTRPEDEAVLAEAGRLMSLWMEGHFG